MQTSLADFIRDTPEGREADAILRKCVHCGFCTATCPTYQVLGDDLDSPRGRIYLIKRALEGAPVTDRTRLHLDRCLTCRACETTCPSGVRYGRLVDIGREVVEARTAARRRGIALQARGAFVRRAAQLACSAAALRLGPSWSGKGAARRAPPARGPRRAMRAGCWCCAAACSRRSRPRSTRRRRACSIASASRCSRCPAPAAAARVRFHLNHQEAGRDDMRALIDAWWPIVSGSEAEAIVMTASGCGVDGEGLRPPAGERRAVPRQGRAHLRDDARPERGDRRAKRSRAGRNRGQGRLPLALHAAARTADPRQGRGAARRASATSCCRCATRTCAAARPAPIRCCSRPSPASCARASSPRWRRARRRRIATANIGCLAHLQAAHRDAGAALDRAGRRGTGVESRAWAKSHPSIVRAACPHDCPDTCAMLVTVEDGVATEIRGDPGDAVHRGHALHQGRALPRAHLFARPAAVSAEDESGRRAKASSSASAGTKRSMRSPRA